MRIEKRTMGWIQKPSAYQHAQQQAAKRREQAKAYLNQQDLLSGAIFNATGNAAAEHTALVFKSVLGRLSEEAQAKLEKGLPTDLAERINGSVDTTA